MSLLEYPLTKGASRQTPNQVIVHAMAEYIFYEDKWRHASEFLEMIGLSAHILIAPNGDTFKCRENNQGAYHAKGFNKDTVGVEWLVAGEHDYTSFVNTIQYPYLSEVQFLKGCGYIKKDWVEGEEITKFRRHSDVSPEGKVDPGEGFPFEQFLKNIGVLNEVN